MPPPRPPWDPVLFFEMLRGIVQIVYGEGESPQRLKVQLRSGDWAFLPIPTAPIVHLATTPVLITTKPEPPPYDHGPDFRSIWWCNHSWPFTAPQAAVVAILYEFWEKRCPDVAQEYLLEAAERKRSSLGDLFQDNLAWGKIIVQGGSRGAYRLIDPSTPITLENG